MAAAAILKSVKRQ